LGTGVRVRPVIHKSLARIARPRGAISVVKYLLVL
jgi:hypothetical protein